MQDVQALSNRVAILARWRGNDHPEVAQARFDLAVARLRRELAKVPEPDRERATTLALAQ